MSKIVRELAVLCYHLDKLYIHEKDRKIKKEIEESFETMSNLLERSIRSQLDENDRMFKRSVTKLKKYIRKIKLEIQNMDRTDKFISGLSGLGEELDKLLNRSK